MVKVIDNYLSNNDHLTIETIMQSNEFPWFYIERKVTTE